jgi:hypothetical protein
MIHHTAVQEAEMTASARRWLRAAMLASMGPRSFDRGNASTVADGSFRALLQWGPTRWISQCASRF